MNSFKNVLIYSKHGNYIATLDDCFEAADQYNQDTFRYITKLQNGKYVIIYNSLYDEDDILAYEISNRVALKTILKSNRSWVLDKPRFIDLKELYDTEIVSEDSIPRSYGSILIYEYRKLYAAVSPNNLLDRPGHTGLSHIGLNKLTTGEYVVTISSECNSMSNIGYTIEPNIVLTNIANRSRYDLLDYPKFKDLKDLYDNK